ncbi:MAG: aspartate ammonia-lyase [Deltaproteobacteria bacterium]|nr:aspartate ammonia-lyase [Deltaproteobacteria bacterium]
MFERASFTAGQLLFDQGKEREALYLILEGEVDVLESVPAGSHRLATCSADTVLGEALLIGDARHTMTARATTDGAVGRLPRPTLEKLQDDDPALHAGLAVAFGRWLVHRMTHASRGGRGLGAGTTLGATRREHDLLGDRDVPADALWGVQTLRAVENFHISGVRLDHFPELIEALADIKRACAVVNRDLGQLDDRRSDAIVEACDELRNGLWHGHFVVDMVQGGAGTSTNMNANEVIANRALEILGQTKGDYGQLHPNTHVNMSQSTNDVYPSALKLALVRRTGRLVEEIDRLAEAFARKGEEFAPIIKMGRTQLQDAVPMTLGQEFRAWGVTIREGAERIRRALPGLKELNMGGTAIGTGINTDARYAQRVVDELGMQTGLDLALAADLVEETQDTSGFVELAGVFKMMAVRLSKICNDLRLLSSGPRCGLGEINLPAAQPGSSIMPGKVNPVIPEVVNQVAFQVIGLDTTVAMAAEAGQLELNVFEPIIAYDLLSAIRMMRRAMETLRLRCIDGITANEEVCRQHVHRSIGVVTALNPLLGYEKTSEVAKLALETGTPVYDLVLERGWLTKEQLDRALSPETMIRPAQPKD